MYSTYYIHVEYFKNRKIHECIKIEYFKTRIEYFIKAVGCGGLRKLHFTNNLVVTEDWAPQGTK